LGWYNATEMSYAEGLEGRDPRLMGEKVGVVRAGGVLEWEVGRHAAMVFRLRSVDDSQVKRRAAVKDEL